MDEDLVGPDVQALWSEQELERRSGGVFAEYRVQALEQIRVLVRERLGGSGCHKGLLRDQRGNGLGDRGGLVRVLGVVPASVPGAGPLVPHPPSGAGNEGVPPSVAGERIPPGGREVSGFRGAVLCR
ncbi:hypothetical protein GCM10009540_85750 [Streptomyces turgidiscabies]